VIQAWITRAGAAPGLVALACILVGIGAAAYTAATLGMHSDIHALVDDEVPFMQLRRRCEQSFPLVDDMLLLVVDGETPRAATRAADALAARLSQESDVFHSAFVPGGGPFFERNALLYLDLDQLEDLADALAQAQPFLAEVERDPSLRAVFGLLSDALDALRRGDAMATDPGPLFDQVAAGLEASNQGRRAADTWQTLLAGEWGQEEQTRQLVLLSPVLDLDAFQPAARAVERVRRVVEEERLAAAGVRVRLTGDFVLTYEENEVLVGQAAAAGAASFVLVGVLLMVAMRSVWLVGATLLTLVLGLAASLAYAAAVVGTLNPVSVAFPVLLIGLSADFGIHLCLRYRELRATGQDHAGALAMTGRGVGSSVVLCAVTTAIGFFAFVPTEFTGLAQLGWIAGPGMLISLFFSLTLLPALLGLAPPRVQAEWAASAHGSAVETSWPVRHPRVVRLSALALGLGGLLLVPRASFDPNQLHVRDPNTESVQAFQDLLASASMSPWTVSSLASDAQQAEEVAQRLRELDVVGRVITPADLVPGKQDEKLEVIYDIASFLPPPAPPRPAPTLEQQRTALREFEEAAVGFADSSDDSTLAASVRRLVAAVQELGTRVEAAETPLHEIERAEASLVDPIDWGITRLRRAVEAEPVTLEDVPLPVREQMIGRDGRLRVEVFPSQDVGDPAELARFVDGVREVAPDVAGHALYLLEFGRSMVRSLQQALLAAVLVIGALLYLLWRRLGDTLIVLAILGLAATLTTAAALLVGIPFNFADVIALPLLLGLGVDSSIHLVHRFRSEAAQVGELLHTSTARAVTYSGLTTLASFGSLAFTPHRGMASIGQLLTIGVLLMLACNLLVLPTLLKPGNGSPPPSSDP